MNSRPAPRPAPQSQPSAGEPPLVSGRWLLSALLLSLLGAGLCAYGTLCLLFYQGQWQLLFHPSHAVTRTPGSAGLPWLEIPFDVTDTGQPRLDGWWIPAGDSISLPSRSRTAPTTASQPYAADTILYLHDGRGSMSDSISALATLHSLGINVFTFDYQGFGHSTGRHPTERLATANSEAAWTWLTDTRHIPARNLVVYGNGVGATFAAHLGARFAPAGVILQDPNRPARQMLAADPRSRILPLALVQNEHLDPAGDLARIHVPTLFLDREGDASRTRALFDAAPYPKQIYALRNAPDAAAAAAVRRFLDEVLH